LQYPAPAVTSLLRVRWPWLAAGVYLGATVGALAVGTTGGAGFRATSVMQIAASTPDGNRVAQLGQSAQLLGRSVPVLEAAADERGTTLGDLTRRSAVTYQPSTDLVQVSVLSDTPQDAVRDANALAEAMVQVSGARAQERLETLREEGDRVLSDDALSDAQAEQARRGALGAAVAARQDEAIASANVVALFEPARGARPAGLSRVVAGALGGVGGLLLAAAGILVLGARRLRIRDSGGLALLAPEVASGSPRVAEEQAGRLLDSGASALIVLCLPGAENQGLELAQRVVRVIRNHDFDAALVDARDVLDASRLRILRRGGDQSHGELESGAQVVLCTTDDETLELVAGQSRLLSLLVLAPRRTTLDELHYVAAAVVSTRPTAVVWR